MDTIQRTKPPLHGALLLFLWTLASTVVGRSFTALDLDPTDARLFAYIGLRWVHGAIPYKSIWDNKPPGIFAINALIFSFAPKNFTALAIAEGIFILGCIGTVYALARQVNMPWHATVLATASVAIIANIAFYNEHGNLTEMYLMWPAALSMYCFVKAGPSFRGKWVLLAGVFSGIAALFKPTGLSPLLAQGVFVCLLWIIFRRLSLRHVLASILINTTGALIAWLPAIIYFWSHHALNEFLDASFLYNFRYGRASQGHIFSIPFDVALNMQLIVSVVVCAAIGLIIYVQMFTIVQRTQESKDDISRSLYFLWPLVLLWVFFDMAGALAGGRNYPHYFLPLAPSLSVAAAFTYWSLIDSIPNEERYRRIKETVLVLIVGPLIFSQAHDVRNMRNLLLTTYAPRVPAQAVASHLNKILNPSDTLFTWDYLPEIYLSTEAKNSTQQLDFHYISDSPKSYLKNGNQTLRELSHTPPTFIVDGPAIWREADTVIRWSGDPVYIEFRKFLESQYVLIYAADNLSLYRNVHSLKE